MIKKVEINDSLFFLEHMLFALDSYKFDKDVLILLNKLKCLVDKKLYSNIDFGNKDIIEQNLFVHFTLK